MAKLHPIKAYRKAQTPPLTQEQLGKKLGVLRETVARWETRAHKIDINWLAKITKKTGIAARDLRPDLADLMEAAE